MLFKKENKKETIIKVDGMVCNGCEKRVQNALKSLDGIEKIVANHEDGTVLIISKYEVEENVIKNKIEDLGFKIKED